MFAAKSIQVNLLTGGRDRLINVLTLAIITFAFGAILCSCGGIREGRVKGQNNDDGKIEFSSKSSSGIKSSSSGIKSSNGIKSSMALGSPSNLGRLSQAKGREGYGYKTSGPRQQQQRSKVNLEQTASSRKTKPRLVHREVSQVGANIAGPKEKSDREHERIVPSMETNGNSQVVYVNLARVVSDKNDTTRHINPQPIKEGTQIGCGETNRNGRPSSLPSNDTLDKLNRIVGGNKAEPGEFPYQVRLNIRSRRGSSLCGGVIIDKRHMLTAAHCVTTW